MAPSFSNTDDKILLEEVANHPSLWLLSHASYKDQRVKDNIWSQIADKVGKPVYQCKKRWRNIKDTYDRKMNRKTADSATKKTKKWVLESKLSFLRSAVENSRSYTKTKQSPKHIIDSSFLPDVEDHTSPKLNTALSTEPVPSSLNVLPQSSTRTSKRKGVNLSENIIERGAKQIRIKKALLAEDDEDDIDLFFRSIVKSVKKLTPVLQQRAKCETLNIINQLETQMWNQLQYGSINQLEYTDPDSSHHDSSFDEAIPLTKYYPSRESDENVDNQSGDKAEDTKRNKAEDTSEIYHD